MRLIWARSISHQAYFKNIMTSLLGLQLRDLPLERQDRLEEAMSLTAQNDARGATTSSERIMI